MKATFPPPLPDAELAELLPRMRSGDPAAREAVYLSVGPAVLRAARRFRFAGRVEDEDMEQEGFLGLWKALPYYRGDPEAGRLAAVAVGWAGQHVRRYVGREVRRSLRFESSDLDGLESEPTPPPEHGDIAADVRSFVDSLSPRQAEVVRLRYGLCGGPGLNQTEAAGLLGTSRQNVQQLEREALRRLAVFLAVRFPSLDEGGGP